MAGRGAKASASLQSRIKRMMQSDEDVGKVAKAAPMLIGAALRGRHCLLSHASIMRGCPNMSKYQTGWSHHTQQVALYLAAASQPTPARRRRALLAAKALDIFLASLVEGAAGIARGRGAKMLTASHM